MDFKSTNLFGIKGTSFDIRLEYNEEYIIVHLPRVSKMDKRAFVEMKTLLNDWIKFFNTVGYKVLFAVVEPNSTTERLAVLLGFTFAAPYEEQHVYKYEG
tara:strand:- start:494 stop:793 length:300 start_codon:yes stop_codon:yes gene_type:complete